MALRILCILSAFLLANPVLPVPEQSIPDTQKIQGAWEPSDVVLNGKSVLKESPRGARMIFAGDKMTLTKGQEPDRNFTFKLDHTKKTKAIDIIMEDGPFKGKTAPGIYRLDGDNLLLCLPNGDSKDRPSEFAAPEKSNLILFTLKRAKK